MVGDGTAVVVGATGPEEVVGAAAWWFVHADAATTQESRMRSGGRLTTPSRGARHATAVFPRAAAVVATVVVLGACQHHVVRLRPAQPRPHHNPVSLGAPWGVVTATLGAPSVPPVTTPTSVTGSFGRCPSSAAAYVVRGVASRSGEAASDMPVVEIDATSCGAPPMLEDAAAQAKAFFPDLSGVAQRRPAAVLYTSQPLIRLVPPESFFVCQALGASAQRLGRFSLRLEPTGWKLSVGDCMSDAPPGSPATP